MNTGGSNCDTQNEAVFPVLQKWLLCIESVKKIRADVGSNLLVFTVHLLSAAAALNPGRSRTLSS